MRPTILFAAVASLASAASSLAEIVTKDVSYEHNGTKLTGFIAYDDAKQGKQPGVIVVHEWWGLNDYPKERARQLAEMGYVAFAIDMFGKPAVTTPGEATALASPLVKNREKMRELALAGLKAFQEQPQVDKDKIAAIGYCFGGTTCLELARAGAPLRGVVSFHGNLTNPNPQDDANIKTSVMVATGGADEMVPPEECVAFCQSMEQNKVDYVFHVYGGAEHAFTNPEADKAGIKSVKYQKEADERSWEHMKQFLAERLGTAAPAKPKTDARPRPTGD